MPNNKDELTEAATTHLFQGPSGGLAVPCIICGVPYGVHIAQPLIHYGSTFLNISIQIIGDRRMSTKDEEEFTVKVAGIVARFPSLKIHTSLVSQDGEVIFTIPHDDLAVLDDDNVEEVEND